MLMVGVLSSACSTAFGGFPDTPDGVYESFWADFRRIYAYKDEIKNPTFEALKAKYDGEPRRNFRDIAATLIKIENNLLDPHFTILTGRGGFPSTGVSQHDYNTHKRTYYPTFEESLFSPSTPTPIVAVSGYAVDAFENFIFGIVDKTGLSVQSYDTEVIGYIGIKNLVLELSGSSRLAGNSSWLEHIETILEIFENNGVTHIAFDIRSDAGGSLYNAKYIAGRFATDRRPAIIAEERLRDDRFQRRTLDIEPEGNVRFTKPIAILINRRTCSGGEMLALFMAARDNATLVGSNSKGCTGAIVERDLPNGWVVRMTSSRTFRVDGTNYFRVGIEPDPGFLAQPGGTKDAILEKAVEALTQ